MPCEKCRKKGIPIKCNFCPGSFCARCIPLETHNCEGLKYKLEKDRDILEEKLKFEPPRKLEII